MARPQHQPTKASRERVSIAAGGGMSHESIAQALGISSPTLRLHYAYELSTGAHQKRMEVIAVAFRTAKKGNTSAAKLFLQHAPEFELAGVSGEAEPAEPKLGKKAQADVDATTAQAGTEWDDLLPRNVTPIRSAG